MRRKLIERAAQINICRDLFKDLPEVDIGEKKGKPSTISERIAEGCSNSAAIQSGTLPEPSF